MKEKKLFYWEFFGVIVIVLLGSCIHFAYDWLVKPQVLAGIFATNESVWEHAKLTFYAPLIFAIIEFFALRNIANNFLIAKVANALVATVATIMLFYTYSGIIGKDTLTADLIVFVISVILGQYISYKLMTRPQMNGGVTLLAFVVLVFMILVFYYFTFYPPKLPLFFDTDAKLYGIVP